MNKLEVRMIAGSVVSIQAAALFLMLVLPGVTWSQSLPKISGDSPDDAERIDGKAAVVMAAQSFASLRESSLEASDGERVRKNASRVEETFNEELVKTLNELKGDGSLEHGEVTKAFERLRKTYEKELLTVISSLREGYEPPPLLREYPDALEHKWALTRYTLFTRNDADQWLKFGGWILAGLVLAWALSAGAKLSARSLSTAGRPALSNILGSLAGPLYLTAIFLGVSFGSDSIWIPEGAKRPLDATTDVILITAIFWLLWHVCDAVTVALSAFIRKSYGWRFDMHMQSVVLRGLRVLVLLGYVGAIVKFVMSTSLTGMLTGLGILGVALYFVLRGTLQNIAASFTILGDKPFRVDDLVVYEGKWGRVEDIGFRSTRVRMLSGDLLTIPNNLLIENAIHNVDARPTVRRRFRIGLVYETPPEDIKKAISIVKDILSDYEGKPENAPVYVEFERFGDYDLQLLIQYHFEPAEYWQAVAFGTTVNLEILSRFEQEGIQIAYPTETHRMHVENEEPLKFTIERNEPGSAQNVPKHPHVE